VVHNAEDRHLSPLAAAPVQDGTEKAKKVFVTVPAEVGQTEAEEIGERPGEAGAAWLPSPAATAAGLTGPSIHTAAARTAATATPRLAPLPTPS
jgi:hypothetical protein